jgi:hypothetical protein
MRAQNRIQFDTSPIFEARIQAAQGKIFHVKFEIPYSMSLALQNLAFCSFKAYHVIVYLTAKTKVYITSRSTRQAT